MDATSARWSCEEQAVWQRIAAHRFDDSSVALDFTRRLTPRALRAAATGVAMVVAARPACGASPLPDIDWPALNPFYFDGDTVLMLYVASAAFVWLLSWLLRDIARTNDRRPDMRDLGDIELGYCVGGNRRAADTLFLALAARGAARLDRKKIVVEDTALGLPPRLEAFRAALAGMRSHSAFAKAFAESEAHVASLNDLLARKILLDPVRRSRLDLATLVPGGTLVVFGFAEVAVGVARDKPVGFLLFFVLVTTITIVAVLARERYLTREAHACLAALRASHDRALRAPRAEELAFAFAMVGTAVLDGTAHADYAKLVKPQDGATAGGSGGGGCGS